MPAQDGPCLRGVALTSELARSRRRLVHEFSESEFLGRQLSYAEATLKRSRVQHSPLRLERDEIQRELQAESAHRNGLLHARSQLDVEANVAEAESSKFRQELVLMSRTIEEHREEANTYRAELGSLAETLSTVARTLDETSALREGLEARGSAMREEASREWEEAQVTSRSLAEKGRNLTWIRSAARSHVEELRVSSAALDGQLSERASNLRSESDKTVLRGESTDQVDPRRSPSGSAQVPI